MKAVNGDTLRRLLREADKNGYAIPAFNFSGLPDLLGIVDAANELHAPIMVAAAAFVFQGMDASMIAAIGKSVMEHAKVPIVLHLDHSPSYELCKTAMDQGFPSVMIDYSLLELEENIQGVKKVVEEAKKNHVHVEGEIGRIKGRGVEGTYLENDFLARPEDAKTLAEETGIDSMAVGIGTAHGFYKGKPELNFTRLQEINECVSLPLVLHGGTGIPPEDVRHAISLGINKVNVGTQIRYVYLNTAKELLGQEPMIRTDDLYQGIRKAVQEPVKEWIKVCMADGKA